MPRELQYFYEKSQQNGVKSKRKVIAKPNLVERKNKKAKKVDLKKIVDVLNLIFFLIFKKYVLKANSIVLKANRSRRRT